MTTLRLYNNEGRYIDADVEQSQPVKVNREFDRIETLKASGDYTQDFELPFTDKLANFLGFIPNVNTVGWFNPKKKIVAEIVSDSIPLIRGYIQILSRTVKGNDIRISVRFTGQVPELMRALGEKRLRDISTLSTLNYELVDASWSDPNANTILTICDRINFGGQFGEGAQAIQDTNYPCYIGQMTPAVKVSYLFNRIINEAGFAFDTSFMDAALNNVYMPFISEKNPVTTARYETLYFQLGLTADVTGITDDIIPTLSEFADNGSNVASGIFTAPYYGQYTFRVWSTITRTAGSGVSSMRADLIVNGAAFGVPAFPMNFSGNQTKNKSAVVTITLNAGDTVQMKLIETSGSATYTIEGNSDNDYQLGTGWQLEAVSQVLVGSDVFVDMALNCPDMKQTDFINGIIRAFKCAVVPDEVIPNRLIIRPMVDYIGSGDTIEWTSRLDTSQAILIETAQEIQPKTFEITYKADGDAQNEYYTKNFNRTFGRYRITEDVIEADEVSDFSVDDQRIELPFGATPCDEINGTTIIAPKFTNTSGEFVLPSPRLLYVSGTAQVQTVTEVFAQVERTVYTLSNYSDTVPDVATLDLNFGIEEPLHNILAYPYQTMWFRFWARYYREIYSKDTAILTASFALDTTEVANLSFADKIWIEHETIGAGYWRLLNVYDFDPEGNRTTRCRLIRLLDLGLDCEAIPNERLSNGQITFTQDGETTDGTFKCCVKYGYLWNTDESKCYVRRGLTGQTSFTQNFIDVEEQRARTVYVSSNYTVQPEDAVINVDSTAGAVDIQLPLSQAMINRTVIVAHHEGNGTVTVRPYKSQKLQDKADVNVGGKGSILILTANENGFNAK